MSEAKYKVGDEVTIRQLRKPHKIEAVKEQYYIRDEGWHDAHELTTYVRPLEVGDRVRIIGGDIERRIIAISKAEAWTVTDADTYLSRPIADLERIPTETGK